MTAKDAGALEKAAGLLPAGTRVNVTFLAGEDSALRVHAARVIRRLGFRAVPHVSARRLTSERELMRYLSALADAGAAEEVCVVGGDPARPAGPYEDAPALIRTGLLARSGVRQVSVAGYPEGHPHIPPAELWRALEDKHRALLEQDLGMTVITQFGFDAAPVVRWLGELRARGIRSPVRVGVPGPVGVKRLLRYARRFGVNSSAGIVRKYGISLTNLLATAGPERFVERLRGQLDPARHGDVRLHLYTFGDLPASARWAHEHRSARTP
ncbi:methylenetetrahydrofolate reductase [Nonomuraea sp. FMUSA5-5]|uniref:Methylenetetrahydrofolate reductase n=1 Tax=Nonomuraea composti TaxID=2720023 RepID=A0ABX1BB99_9ACTN|nr:methylenetetrahydrofolate reductase [Nonomuraea sp. FMUSA5-5]NJP94826.1 methylenetetrahydrofolate reductase [Nonomuraea sp. FMUSA5-5]